MLLLANKSFCLLIVSITLTSIRSAKADDSTNSDIPGRPNIVWIISEDNSKHYLKHFDVGGAPTPNIESMARHGVTFDRAFSCAPVCSVARTTLISGCYAPRIGTQFHRRIAIASMPNGIEMFPAYLRTAGYYTTNQSKQDYNAHKSAAVWDASSSKASWNNRPSQSTPFFHVQTTVISHESCLHFPSTDLQKPTAIDQQAVPLQPYFPDTPLFRYTAARYRDQIMAVDQVVGQVVAELESAGELENTFVFYFGDHGGAMPRSKGYLYGSGLHVSLVVRIPERYQALAGRELNSRTTGFVEFVDFGPTVLALAGIKSPSGIDGKPFLGMGVDRAEVDARHESLGYADRFDEKCSLVRSLRQGKFKYIRNFEPFYPDGLQNNYRYKALAYQQWRQLYAAGKLNQVQRAFFEPKQAEALYDLDADPDETVNLAGQPQHARQLAILRQRLFARIKAMPDLSLIPEAMLVDQMANPVEFGQRNKARIATLIDTVNLALQPYHDAEASLRQSLAAGDPLVRYWAIVAASSFGKQARPLLPVIEASLHDTEPLVAMRAAEFVAISGGPDPRPALIQALGQTSNQPEALRLLNTAVYIHDYHGDRYPIDVHKLSIPFEYESNSELGRRMEYLTQP